MKSGRPRLLGNNRQASVDTAAVSKCSGCGSGCVRDKELVHKCHSDPGGGRALGANPRGLRHRSTSGAARKCVLTLDGYSYVIVASPPERGTDDTAAVARATPPPPPPPPRNGQNKSFTILRRTNSKKKENMTEEELDKLDMNMDNLPQVDTPEACDKAAIRLRYLLRQLQNGEVSAETLQRNLQYAVKVLEAVYLDETKRLAEDDDELSEVQPDAVPLEVREWLTSTFTRQLTTAKRKSNEKPKFRSVANAIRAGIFVDRIYRRLTTSAILQFPQDVVRILKTLDSWSFDVFALSEASNQSPIKYLAYDLLNRYGLIHKFKVPPTTLEAFLNRIEEGYLQHNNPYHNNLHSSDVAQTIHYMLSQTGLMNWLTDLEIYATLVAAIIHDYDHTGTTNNFHVMTSSPVALTYNDRAVLENHHISAAFKIILEEETNILMNLSKEEYREFRELVIDMVLATDMSFHFQQIKNMKSLLSLTDPTIDKSKALALVLHCCDISHPAKPWHLHHRWTMNLLEEFFRQGDREQALGLPFSPLCDRNSTLIAESQIGFIEFIVEPSMAVCTDLLQTILLLQSTPKASTSNCDFEGYTIELKKPWFTCLLENKMKWKDLAAIDAETRKAEEEVTTNTHE